MDAQVLARDVQIQQVVCTSNNAFAPANLNIFAKTINAVDRLHFLKPRDFNKNVKNSWAHAGRKMSLVLANFNGFAKSLKSVRTSYIFDRWRDRSE